MPNYRSANDSSDSSGSPQSWHWSLTVLIIGIIVGSVVSLHFRASVELNIIEFWGIVLLLGLIGAGVQYKRFKKKNWLESRKGIGKFFFFLYNTLGVGLISMSVILISSIYIPISDPVSTEYNIVSNDPTYMAYGGGKTVLLLENDQFDYDPHYRGIPHQYYGYTRGCNYTIMGFETYTGLFGFKVKSRRYVRFNYDDIPEGLKENCTDIDTYPDTLHILRR
jgi:hypothetical protein